MIVGVFARCGAGGRHLVNTSDGVLVLQSFEGIGDSCKVTIGHIFNDRFTAIDRTYHCFLFNEIVAFLTTEMDRYLVDVTLLEFLVYSAGNKALVGGYIEPLNTVLSIGADAVTILTLAVEFCIIRLLTNDGYVDIKGQTANRRRVTAPGISTIVTGQVSVCVGMLALFFGTTSRYCAGVSMVQIVDLAVLTPSVITFC